MMHCVGARGRRGRATAAPLPFPSESHAKFDTLQGWRARAREARSPMEIRQSLKQSMNLVMTPQLQQAIRLLQLSRAELVEEIRRELESNPVLAEDDGQAARLVRDEGSPTDADAASAMTERIDASDQAVPDARSMRIAFRPRRRETASGWEAPSVAGSVTLDETRLLLSFSRKLAPAAAWPVKTSE